jgi:LacI family transcriptional regulator
MTILYFQPTDCHAGRMKLSGARAASSAAGATLQLVETPNLDTKRAEELLAFWRPDACIVESGDNSNYLKHSIFKGVRVAYIDRDPATLPKNATTVNINTREIGAAAARELMSLGLVNFACIPAIKDVFWAKERTSSFLDALKLNGRKCNVFNPTKGDMITKLSQWLTSLPRPCGIFVATDQLGSILLPVIKRLGMSVPNDFAVVGVDNDETLCEALSPTLSSIQPDFRQAGRMAVEALLNQRGITRHLFGISGIVRRASSFIPLRHTRPGLTAVMDTIRLNACDGLSAAAAAKKMGVSRRLAERLFKEAVGLTILEAIHSRRLERAAELVKNSDNPLEMIPGLVGWKSATAFRVSFRNKFGMTMREMRQSTLKKHF